VDNESEHAGEARGDLRVRYDPAPLGESLPPIQGELTAALIDEIPVLVVFGSQTGGLAIRDARELRIKESDRIAAVSFPGFYEALAAVRKDPGARSREPEF
jgi:3-phosphoshikimate 1-carboxyvinyltransferase